MSNAEPTSLSDVQVDVNNLYREEAYTDMKVASIRALVPVKLDGSVDETRERIFMGTTHVMSQMGPVPVSGRIEAKTLEEALEKFPGAIQKALEEMIEEAKEARRQEASRIVVPNAGAAAGLAGQGPAPGGQAGGPGIIKI